MLERLKHEKTVDVYGHVTCLRAQRNYMVQTEDQYIFIHDALLEAVLAGNTEVTNKITRLAITIDQSSCRQSSNFGISDNLRYNLIQGKLLRFSKFHVMGH